MVKITERGLVPVSCTRVHSPNIDDDTGLFDYQAYADFWAFKGQLEKYKRRRSICLGKSVKKLEDYSDDVLKRELEKQYGLMDTASSIFCNLFSQFKAQRLSELRKWIEKEEKLKETDASTLKRVNTAINHYKEMLAMYSFCKNYQEEVDQYKCDWFELPRITITPGSDLPNGFEICQQEMGRGRGRIQEPITLSSAVESENSTSYGDIFNRAISSQLSIKFYVIINQFPLGVTERVFLKRFLESYGHLPNFLEKFYPTFLDMCTNCDDIFCVPDKLPGRSGTQLLFPASLIDSPYDIDYYLAKIKHYIKAVVSMNLGNIEVNKVLRSLRHIFGMDMKPEEWEFKNSVEFVEYIVNNDEDLKIQFRNDNVYYLSSASYIAEASIRNFSLSSKSEIDTASSSCRGRGRTISNIDMSRIKMAQPNVSKIMSP